MNVGSQYLDVAKRDLLKTVIRSTDDTNLKKLLEIGDFVKTLGRKSNGLRIKSLTTDTANCFVHTCKGLVELAVSLLSMDHEYVMLGYFTSDFIE